MLIGTALRCHVAGFPIRVFRQEVVMHGVLQRDDLAKLLAFVDVVAKFLPESKKVFLTWA